MNRKNLTSAVLAGLAGAAGIASTAQAVNLNPDGLGQVLIYPYYTVNATADGESNITVLSVVNTTEEAKAVKVRFNEGQNSQEVLDFNLYLSPFDVWTASVQLKEGVKIDATGAIGTAPVLNTDDTSCTVPDLAALTAEGGFYPDGIPFQRFKLDDTGTPGVFEPVFTRGTEGHFEMIEMGVVTDETEGSASAATHIPVSGGAITFPADCDQLNQAWTGGVVSPVGSNYWILDPTVDMAPPSGGLFGGAAIINVAGGAMFSYDAKAINGWSDDLFDTQDVPRALHSEPGSELPSLNSGNQFEATVFLDNGETLTSGELDRPVDAVSFLFMHDQIINEYVTDNRVQGATEWVMTFPTKRFYTHTRDSDSLVPLAPFTEMWSESIDTDGDDEADAWGACEIVRLSGIYDREEQVPGTVPGEPIPPIISPAPPPGETPETPVFELCYETSVIEFAGIEVEAEVESGGQSSLLGSYNFHTINNGALGFQNGWVRLEMDDYTDGTGAELSRDPLGGLEGLPVTGFAVTQYGNATLGSSESPVLANYGGIFQHKGTRKAASS
jgi:hypothetical protein